MTWDLFHPNGHLFYGAFKTREEAEKTARMLAAGFIAIPAIENTGAKAMA